MNRRSHVLDCTRVAHPLGKAIDQDHQGEANHRLEQANRRVASALSIDQSVKRVEAGSRLVSSRLSSHQRGHQLRPADAVLPSLLG